MALDTKGKQALEMLNSGRAHATLPLPNGLLADTKEPAQFSLGQVHALAQRRTGAPKGVLTFEVIGMRLFHLPSLLHATAPVCSFGTSHALSPALLSHSSFPRTLMPIR